jgi:hypothetical protein
MGTTPDSKLDQNLLEGASFNFRNAVLWPRRMESLVRGPSEHVQASATPGRPFGPVFDTDSVLRMGYELGHNITSNHPDVSCDRYGLVRCVPDDKILFPF